MFEILAKAKAGALYKLLSKLPVEEAAIVLTHLPNQLAIQVIAYYPGEMQAEIGPAMVDARWAEPEKIALADRKIRHMLQQAKQSLAAKSQTSVLPKEAKDAAPQPTSGEKPTAALAKTERETAADEQREPPPPPAPPPAPQRRLVERARPGTPVARPASSQFGKGGNPYQAAAETAGPPKAIPPQTKPGENAEAKPGLAARAKELAKSMMRPPPARPPAAEKRKNEGPKPWVPRQATSSPINGPALPGTPPPVAGDPFASPLAKAGLLDLIGRAQEKLLPKGSTLPSAKNPVPAAPSSRPPQRPKIGKNGRPEPLEGILAPGSVDLVKTPRVIGPGVPRPDRRESAPPPQNARRMDGKAILAAILREAGPSVRGTVRHDDPVLFKQLRDRMFYFDDLVLTEDNALARVFTAAPTEDSALALKFASPALRDKVLRAVSPGRARALREHAGDRAGLSDIEKAQQTVLDVALQLQSAGRILIDPRDPDLAGK